MPPNKLRKTLSEQKMCSKQISSGSDATFDCAPQDAGASGLEHNSFKRTYDLRAFLDQAWSTSHSWGNTVVVCWRTFCLLCCGHFWELKSHTAHAFAAFGWSGPSSGWHCLLGSLPERIGSSRTLTALCMWFDMHLLGLYRDVSCMCWI